MRFAVVQFAGSAGGRDAVHALTRAFGQEASLIWHQDGDLAGADAVILPGGSSYGDHLRKGALALTSPIIERIQAFAASGGLVLGIGNGFQILCEAGLLPGALIQNRSLRFLSDSVFLRTATRRSPFTRSIPVGRVLRLPIAHGAGCFFADPETVAALRAKDQILWEYSNASGNSTDDSNPNGSIQNIAGVCNSRRNVAGLMPHPERACDAVLGNEDGRLIFDGVLAYLRDHAPLPAR